MLTEFLRRALPLCLLMLPLACDSDDGGSTQADATADTGSPADTTADTTNRPDTNADADDGDVVDAVVPSSSFTVRPGVETVTVTEAAPGTPLTLYGPDGDKLVTLEADEFGQAHIAYLPPTHQLLNFQNAVSGDVVRQGTTVPPGSGYVLSDDSQDPPDASAPFAVLAQDDVLDPGGYEGQILRGIHFGVLGLGQGEVEEDGFNYITMRDGVRLGAMVRLPDPLFWGDGPYPTVIEYSGYSPSNPRSPDAGTRIATLLGFATVGVNMRGSGCSGGVFDVFNPAQSADGYDVIEVVARQDWVLGGQVGMIGLSYPGISQLFVAATRPPSLAAITPLSVLADPWVQLWPGGIYNDGFTRQWLEQRDADASPNGLRWTDRLIEAGDTVCEAHQILRNQNIAFERFFKELEFYPPSALARSLPLLVPDIDVPVFLTGAFQDEQTGAEFTHMLDRFESVPTAKFTIFNGRHVDGYSALVLTRWWEFLQLYVGERVPRMDPVIRELAGPQLSAQFDATGLGFEPDRFTAFADDDYSGVLAAYEAEPLVRVLFENGAGNDEPGAPIQRYEKSYQQWPPAAAQARSFYLDADGTLSDSAPGTPGVDRYSHDPEAGSKLFFGDKGYQLLVRLWDIDWTRFEAGKSLAYITAPLTEDLVLAGPGYVELWIESEVDDVNVQVSLSEVRPDGNEYLIQSGWHRLAHRVLDEADATDGLRIGYTFDESGFERLTPGEVIETKIPIASVAHALRVGSQLLLTIATPGRNHGTWEFKNPDYGGDEPTHRVSRGGARPSKLVMSVVDDVTVPEGLPACPSLRGQPCRPYVESVNLTDDPQ